MNGPLRPRVLVVGDAAHGDFAAINTVLRATARILFVPDVEHAAAWLSGKRQIDWVVLVQSRPGQLPRNAVERLRPMVGPASFVSVLGSWCEGELRTGRPWSDVPRCYWYAFPSWWRSQMSESTCNVDSSFVVVSAVDYAAAESLLDALATEGFSGVWWPRHGSSPTTVGVSAGIWIGAQLGGEEAFQLDAFCRRMRLEQAPVIALLDFPRRDRVELARRIGAAEVLGKPWLLTDIARTLRKPHVASCGVTSNHSPAIQSA